MARFVVCCGLLLFTAFEVGCCNSCKTDPKCSGCGELYLGAYVDDPPRAEPCDRCGNYVGCDPCAERMPWNRSRGQFFQTINDYVKRRDSKCCDGDCGCAEECDGGCGAAGSGDAGCGCGAPAGGTIYQDDGEVFMSRAKPNSSMMQNISRTRPVATVGSRSPQACNCGNH